MGKIKYVDALAKKRSFNSTAMKRNMTLPTSTDNNKPSTDGAEDAHIEELEDTAPGDEKRSAIPLHHKKKSVVPKISLKSSNRMFKTKRKTSKKSRITKLAKRKQKN